jgi:hypothetical protein
MIITTGACIGKLQADPCARQIPKTKVTVSNEMIVWLYILYILTIWKNESTHQLSELWGCIQQILFREMNCYRVLVVYDWFFDYRN